MYQLCGSDSDTSPHAIVDYFPVTDARSRLTIAHIRKCILNEGM